MKRQLIEKVSLPLKMKTQEASHTSVTALQPFRKRRRQKTRVVRFDVSVKCEYVRSLHSVWIK